MQVGTARARFAAGGTHADHGGLVVIKTQPGVVQSNVTAGGGQ